MKLIITFVLVISISARAQQQTQPTTAPADDPAFVPIFDGKSLTGWDGDPKYWRVENGVLIGEITPGNQTTQNSFIIWRGGTVRDFEFKCEYRVTAQGNSGINYRSTEVPDMKYVMRGYQYDIDGEKRNTGITRHTGNNYEERGRTFMALRGQVTRAIDGGARQIVSSLGDYTEMTKLIKSDDWNQIHIIARGSTMIHMLNGHVMSVLVDDDEKNRVAEGLIGVQVHQGPVMKIEYRNMLLRRLNLAQPH